MENRYRVLRCIGRGGMGSVYLAEHVRIQRKVAIKVLHGAVAAAPGLVARFHREAVAAAAVGNEHVVTATDMGQLDNGAYYLVLEYLQGVDLNWRVVNDGTLSIAQSLNIALQLCDALAAVHAAEIVHRDLKPENLFLCERAGESDFLKVLDFGVCKMQPDGRTGQQPLTGTGAALGTPHYMAPEQIEGRPDIDQRADLYAVGGILYFMLVGDPPFDAAALPCLFTRICQEPAPSLLRVRPDVPSEFDAIVRKSLAKRPEDRYASAWELRDALLPLSAAYSFEHTDSRRQRAAVRTLIQAGVGKRALRPTVQGSMTGYVATQASMPDEVFEPTSAVSARHGVPGKRRWPLRVAYASSVVLAVTLMAASAQLRSDRTAPVRNLGESAASAAPPPLAASTAEVARARDLGKNGGLHSLQLSDSTGVDEHAFPLDPDVDPVANGVPLAPTPAAQPALASGVATHRSRRRSPQARVRPEASATSPALPKESAASDVDVDKPPELPASSPPVSKMHEPSPTEGRPPSPRPGNSPAEYPLSNRGIIPMAGDRR